MTSMFSERGLGKRELEGDLAAQLMSGVGDEAPVRFGEVPGCRCRQRPDTHSVRAAWMRPGSTVYCPATKRATTALVITPWVTLTHASPACSTAG